jgi:hypothetical protein
MNVEIGTEAAQFTEKEYINGIFLAVYVMDSKQEYKIIKQESFILRQMFSILVIIKSASINFRILVLWTGKTGRDSDLLF